MKFLVPEVVVGEEILTFSDTEINTLDELIERIKRTPHQDASIQIVGDKIYYSPTRDVI